MDIKRTAKPLTTGLVKTPVKAEPKKNEAENSEIFADSYEPGTIEAGISVAGGLISLAGAVTNQPIVAGAGAAVSLVGVGLSAKQVYDAGGEMNKAAYVSIAAATALPLASALILTAPSAAAAGPQGPLPQFLREIGVKALPM